jgi:RNA polymerase-interacting CarD/CdnL/TRCF family regulator
MGIANHLYGIGDWIVHNRYGVGQIKSIDRKQLQGNECKYFKVKTFNAVYWLPTDKTDVNHIRPVSSNSTFQKALVVIRRHPKDLDDDYRKRASCISEVLSNGALIKLARLIRDLNGRQRIKKLNLNEEETLNRLKTRFIDEWVVSSGIDRDKADNKLNDALQKSRDTIIN